MSDRLRIPGERDVRASLDTPTDWTDSVVVACPPHPQMGGDRRDARLRSVSEALTERAIACLRIDYGPWDGGVGAQTDATRALAWAHDEYDSVGLFGYSFGGGVALVAAATAFEDGEDAPAAVSVLAPPATLADEDTAAAVSSIACPLQVLYGERDSTVDSEPVAERAREAGGSVETLGADHFFVGRQADVAERVGRFFQSEV